MGGGAAFSSAKLKTKGVIVENLNTKNLYSPPVTQDYVPGVVKRLLGRIQTEQYETLALYGFGRNMKWIYRLLQESGKTPILCDWRPEFIGYDCGGLDVISVQDLQNYSKCLLVLALEDIEQQKAAMRYLFLERLSHIPVIYDRSESYNPIYQQEPYKKIYEKACGRATSMISDDQLFDLIQYIRLTKDIPGDVVEFGSLYGGSGAVIAEALNFFGKKPLWLFDSFSGIPKSRYGLDHRWNNEFSDNSFAEVRNAFADLDHVKVIAGNLVETHKLIENPVSFGYIASDTLESGELLLNFLWPKLSPGGIIAICDYGSFPNCIPLTMFADYYFEDKADAFIFFPAKLGIFILKKY
jgi:O-methyltransferase